MMQTKQALNGHNLSEEDPNSFGSTGHFNAQYSSEPNHYSAENETYEDVEEREYEENEEEQRGDYHQEQGNTEQYQENQGEEHEEIEGQDETNSGTVRGERNNRNIASRESKKRGGDNPLSQVKENPEENNNDEEGEEGLMGELKALAGSTSNKSKQLKSQGEKSQWDPRYFNDRFNFEQLGGKSFNAKVTPTKFHKHYDKFCKEFLDKKEEGLQQKRREKQDAEVAGLQEKPKLVSKGQTKPYVPLLDRTPIMDARREKELEKIKQEKEEKLLRELEELTFAPKINPKSKKLSSPSREKIMKMYLQTRFNHSPVSARNGERSHTPKINSRSRNIADTTREHASRDVVDRLYIDADVGKTKKDRLAQQLTPSFSPKLNRNTRKIAKQIERNYNTYDDRNSRFETEGNYSRDTEKYSSQKRMATEGDTQNLSDLDQSTDYELLQILKQFNEMLKQKNENPITLDQLSALMSSYSQKKRANSSQRNDDQNATEQYEDNVIYEENDSQRPPNTDRPLRSNLNEQSSESFENQNKSLRVQTNTPNSSRQKETPKKSSNFMSPRSQAGAQSPVRSQSPISSPTKKSGALMSHLIQNPRCKNKNDDRPTTSINQAIMQKALKGSPLKGGKISPTTQKLDKSQNKEVSLDKSNTFEKATQTSKKSKQSEQAQEDQINQDVVEDLGLANQDQNEIVHEYVLNNHEEEKHKRSAIPYGNDLDEYNNEYHSHKDHSENILNQEGSHHAADEHHKQEGQDVQNQNNSYSRKGDSKNPSYSKIAEKSKVATSKQSIRGSNKSSLNSLNHHEEQGYTSKYKGKSIYSTQKGGQSKNGLSQKESVNQVEEERASEKEQVQPELNESQQKAEEHSFSANTIENHNSSFDDNQANQAEQRTLEELVSASKASSIRQYEAEPPKRTSPRKPQIQFEVITTETIQIQPSSTKKTNFTFSMDGGDKAFPTASGTGLKQMAQQIVKKFRAYDNQIKQSSREYRVSVSPAKTNSPSPDSRDNSESKASKNEPKVFKSVVEKGASSKSSKKAKASLQGSLSSVHSGRESFLAKKGAVGGVGTPRRSDF